MKSSWKAAAQDDKLNDQGNKNSVKQDCKTSGGWVRLGQFGRLPKATAKDGMLNDQDNKNTVKEDCKISDGWVWLG